MTAPDFSDWHEPWPLTPTLRTLAEPRPVIVDINRVLPLAKHAQRPDRLPLRVLAGGLRLEATMPGKSHAWARLGDGQWLACAKFASLSETGKQVSMCGYGSLQTQYSPTSLDRAG
jgi:hypothetical protein